MEDKQMTFDEKIKEYKDHLQALNEIDSLEVKASTVMMSYYCPTNIH